MTKINSIAASGIVAAAVAGILSVGSALADSRAMIGVNQFGSTIVPVETTVGAPHDGTTAGFRQVAQPQGWMPIVIDDTQRR